jgi:hypothetical protein
MMLDLFRVENGRPVRAPEDALRPSFEVSGLCPDGTILTSAPASTPGEETVGRWATGLQLGTTLGHCELYATIEENTGDGSWWPALGTGPSASVWTVKMKLQTPLDRVIIVGVENTPVKEQSFPYYIWPTDYDPEQTAIFFAVAGQVVGLGETSGRGDGVLTIGPGAVELDPEEECTVQGVLNPGMLWGRASDNPVHLQLAFEREALSIATARVHIAMDGNRDDEIDFNGPEDKRYLFWVNDDHDEQNYLQTEFIWVEDDTTGAPNCNDDWIGHSTSPIKHGCKRDLEDFTRVHFQADQTASDLSNLVYSLEFRDVSSGDPAVNIFEAVDCSMKYLQDSDFAEDQIEKERLVTVDAAHEALIESRYISAGTENSCFILEGKRTGKGDLTLLVKKNGIVVSAETVELDLRPIGEFYEKYTVSLSSSGEVNPMSVRSDSATYEAEADEYVLFVHGYNVPEYTTDRWAETTFKRLWWLGYKGHLGAFRWPEVEGTVCAIDDPRDFSCYNKSDFRAWNSARALRYLLPELDSRFPGQVRILAHSQGNIVTGEALRQLDVPLSLRYIAAQAAVSARTYDHLVPHYSPHVSWHPDVYGHFYSGGTEDSEYFSNVLEKPVQMFRYFNKDDYALKWWRTGNEMKAREPMSQYRYSDRDGDRNTYNPDGGDLFYWGEFDNSGWLVEIRESYHLPEDRYKIFSFCARSRSLALGAVATPVDGFDGETNLEDFGFNDKHYSHSKQYRSNIVDEQRFWQQVIVDFEVSHNHFEED